MTEETINGIDVSECCFYNNGKCDNPNGMACNCINNAVCYFKELKRLEQELKWANDEEKYLKDCCIKAGKELEKHSFKWDGKEKNLVVQALQLNQLYKKLEQENKELKEEISLQTNYTVKKFYTDKEYNELKQENKELKEEIQILKKDSYTRLRELSVLDAELDEVGVMNKKYRSALEEINTILDDTYRTGRRTLALAKIRDKIDEVLK